ncbi:flavodoxin [Sporolactobacillus sp. THM7-4]|nr:flavodoxin [Sporolactobacillus sp. THM7-4]
MMKATILYASMTGNDEEIANILISDFNQSGVATELKEIDEADVKDFDASDICIIVTYTYDDGDIPEEALDLYDDLDHYDLSNKIFGVCGSGDTCYGDFCMAVDKFEKRLLTTGAQKGADSVKIELYPEEEDKEKLMQFVQSIVNSAQTMLDKLQHN